MPAVDDDGDIVIFNGANDTDSLNFKSNIIGKTNDDGDIGNVEIMITLKYLSNFWRTLEMSLINCETELILNWSENCVMIYTDVNNQVPTLTITETNLYVPVVTLPKQDNTNLLPKLKNDFKRTISWNKCLAKSELLAQNANLNHLIEFNFKFSRCKQTFCSRFENDAQRTGDKRCYIPNVEIKDYNVMI